MTNKVRVVCRIRPIAKYEIDNGSKQVVSKVPGGGVRDDESPETLQIDDETMTAKNNNKWFELDSVMDETSTQRDVYRKSGAHNAVTNDLFSGYNTTILAYGQTGSGKTFTMGTAGAATDDNDQNDGVIPRCCRDLFDNIRKKCDGQAEVLGSYMEVYNEEINDLLVDKKVKQDLRIRETLDGQIYVRGLSEHIAKSPEDVYRIMNEGNGRRVVASTKMNAGSSRSHAICTLKVKGIIVVEDDKENGESKQFEAKLTLVDLAGSERLKKTMAKGAQAKEGISINKGLFVLGQVVSALAEQGRATLVQSTKKKKKRSLPTRKPPYRDSKLTRLLQDSLGGNSRTIMIACVSPADFNVEETVNTLRYATQARNISNTATANLVTNISQQEARKLKRENVLLKEQIKELESTITKLTQDVTADDLKWSMSLIKQEHKKSERIGKGRLPPIESNKKEEKEDDPNQMSTVKKRVDPPEDIDAKPQQDTCEDTAEVGNDTNSSLKATLQSSNAKNDVDDDATTTEEEKNSDVPSLVDEEDDLFDVDSLQRSRASGRAHSHREIDCDDDPYQLIEEMEIEIIELEARLMLAERDVRATIHESGVELPALKTKVQQLEDSLTESKCLAEEKRDLQEQLDEVISEKEAAQRAAQQLTDFVTRQQQKRSDIGARSASGPSSNEYEKDNIIIKQRIDYCSKKLNEDWMKFVVIVLNSFKEEMRLLGDYFNMVVDVTESPDVLGMLGTMSKNERTTIAKNKDAGVGWWKSKEQKEKELLQVEAEKRLRNDLLREHIKFFNERLVEIEDEVNFRSETVDAILEGLSYERGKMEIELGLFDDDYDDDEDSAVDDDDDHTEFSRGLERKMSVRSTTVRDMFSKDGLKLLIELDAVMAINRAQPARAPRRLSFIQG